MRRRGLRRDRSRDPGGALDLRLPSDPRRCSPTRALPPAPTSRAPHLTGDTGPAHDSRRLQAVSPACNSARHERLKQGGAGPSSSSTAPSARRQETCPHRGLQQGDRHHPPSADQRRPRRFRARPGTCRHLSSDAGEQCSYSDVFTTDAGDGRRPRRAALADTRTCASPAGAPALDVAGLARGAHRHRAAAGTRSRDTPWTYDQAYLVVPSALKLSAQAAGRGEHHANQGRPDVVPSADPRHPRGHHRPTAPIRASSAAVPSFLLAAQRRSTLSSPPISKSRSRILALQTGVGFDVDGVEVRAQARFRRQGDQIGAAFYTSPSVALSSRRPAGKPDARPRKGTSLFHHD